MARILGLWSEPLTKGMLDHLTQVNTPTCDLTFIECDFGTLVKAALKERNQEVYYCGGDNVDWVTEDRFLEKNPEFGLGMMTRSPPEFDLDDMELAEILMEEMK